MKTGQWILAVCILAAMVFGISWALTHDFKSGGAKPPIPGRAGSAALRLKFPNPKYPPGGQPVICEVNKEGECDFYFTNPNDREVKVGLLKKTCKCAGASLYVVPPATPATFMAATVGFVGTVPEPCGCIVSGVVPRLSTLGLAIWQEEWVRLQQSSGGGVELTEEPGVSGTVPPQAIGRVHLRWKTERPEPRTLQINLWTDHPTNTVSTELTAQAAILPVLQVVGSYDCGVLEDGQLPFKKDVYCFSATREFIPIKARIKHDNRLPEKDPVEVGPVVECSPEESAELASKTSYPVRSAYKTTVTLRRTSPNGTMPMEMGAFYRYVEFIPDAAGIEPLESAITGQVLAVVTVGDGESAGHIQFGPFVRSEGKSLKTLLQSDAPNLELEVDPTRVPVFLDPPKLKLVDVTPSGHRSWELEMQVPPNKAAGRFPNAEDPAYRDSAIYIKTKEKAPRTIRIPVSGVANDG
jgi:hypothetical protein